MLDKTRGLILLVLPALLCSLPSCSRADQVDDGASKVDHHSTVHHGGVTSIAFGPGGPGNVGGFGGFIAHNGPPPFPPPILPPPGGPPMGLPLAGLDLTDAQVESIHNRRAEFAEKIDPLMSQLHSKRRKTFELLLQSNVDAGAVHSLQSEISELQAKVDSLMTDQVLATSASLTTEQKTKMRLSMMRKEVSHPMPPPGMP